MIGLQLLPLPKKTQHEHYCLFSVSSMTRVCSLDCLGIKALENQPRKVSLSLNDTGYITAPSVQTLLAFENISVLTHLAHD